MSLESRITKIERTLGNADEGTFSQYFQEFLTLIGGRSRGLPSEEKEDPEFEAACDRLFKNTPINHRRQGARDLRTITKRRCNPYAMMKIILNATRPLVEEGNHL